MVPMLRDCLCFGSKVSMVDVSVWVVVAGFYVGLYEAILGRGEKEKEGDGMGIWGWRFGFCCWSFVGSFLGILGMYVVHKVYWEKKYNKGKQ